MRLLLVSISILGGSSAPRKSLLCRVTLRPVRIVSAAFILICVLRDLFTSAALSRKLRIIYAKKYCNLLAHLRASRSELILKLRWKSEPILELILKNGSKVAHGLLLDIEAEVKVLVQIGKYIKENDHSRDDHDDTCANFNLAEVRF